MIILSDRNIPQTKFLIPVHQKEWRSPSEAQKKDQFGNPVVCTKFKITAKLNDGAVRWIGWFDSRDDFDAFLFAILNKTLPHERELWDLPNETWVPKSGYGNLGWTPDVGKNLTYEFATNTFLTSTSTGLSYSRPTDWLNNDNSISCIGGGGTGANAINNGAQTTISTGGGGGGFGKLTNYTLPASASYKIGAGGSAVSGSANTAKSGNNGGDTWFDGADYASAALGAAGGKGGAGVLDTLTATSGGAGGGYRGTGTTGNTGGAGGDVSTSVGSGFKESTGGGGAAGPNGNGNPGVSATAAGVNTTKGGSGDAGSGGSGGNASSGDAAGGNGGNGTEFSASYGCGGGGGAQGTSPSGFQSGDGGTYGGASGAYCSLGTVGPTGAGKNGLIYISYTPYLAYGQNIPMLGL